MLIRKLPSISLHHVSIFLFINDRNIYHFYNFFQVLKIDKMPPKQVIFTSLDYGRSSRSLYLLTFVGGMFRVVWIKNSEGLRSQILINLRLMGSQPLIGHVCLKKHKKYDNLLKTQFLS